MRRRVRSLKRWGNYNCRFNIWSSSPEATKKAFTLRDLIKCQSQTCAVSENPPRLCVAQLRNISNSNNERKKEKLCERIFICPRKKIEMGRDEASSRKVIKCWENSFSYSLEQTKEKMENDFSSTFLALIAAFSLFRARFCLFSQPQEQKH